MANNDVQHLLDMLYEMIDGAKNAPLTSDKCILNRDEALDLLDEIRAQLPVELSRAQELIRAKEDYVKAAMPPHGWQRASRRSDSHSPFNGPYLRSASRAYCEQVGVKRHDGGVNGEMQSW